MLNKKYTVRGLSEGGVWIYGFPLIREDGKIFIVTNFMKDGFMETIEIKPETIGDYYKTLRTFKEPITDIEPEMIDIYVGDIVLVEKYEDGEFYEVNIEDTSKPYNHDELFGSSVISREIIGNKYDGYKKGFECL